MVDRYSYTTENIRILTALDAVRQRPGMYIGSTCARGIEHLVYECIGNIVTLQRQGEATCIDISYDTTNQTFTICDDGSGLPFEKKYKGHPAARSEAEGLLERLSMGSPFDSATPIIRLVTGSLGLACVTALSSLMLVQSWRQDTLWHKEYRRGKPSTPAHIIQRGKGKGTVLQFTPDPAIFDGSAAREEVIAQQLHETIHLFPTHNIIWQGNPPPKERGLHILAIEHLESITGTIIAPKAPVRSRQWQENDIQYDIALVGESDAISPEQTMSWCNGARTREHGTHVQALIQALRDTNQTPAAACIHTVMCSPTFAGSTRDRLSLSDTLRDHMAASISRRLQSI